MIIMVWTQRAVSVTGRRSLEFKSVNCSYFYKYLVNIWENPGKSDRQTATGQSKGVWQTPCGSQDGEVIREKVLCHSKPGVLPHRQKQ